MHTHIIKVNDAQQQSPLHLAVIRAHKHKQSKEDVDICREILERIREAAEVNIRMDAHASRYLHSDRPIERDIDGCIVVQMDSMQHLDRVGESGEVGDPPIDQTRASVPASCLHAKTQQNPRVYLRAPTPTLIHTHAPSSCCIHTGESIGRERPDSATLGGPLLECSHATLKKLLSC